MTDRGHGIRCECVLCQHYMVENERNQLQKQCYQLEQQLSTMTAERNSLLGLVEKHREALKYYADGEHIQHLSNGECVFEYGDIALQALALQSSIVRLVEIGTISGNDVFLHSDLKETERPLYTIEEVKGE